MRARRPPAGHAFSLLPEVKNYRIGLMPNLHGVVLSPVTFRCQGCGTTVRDEVPITASHALDRHHDVLLRARRRRPSLPACQASLAGTTTQHPAFARRSRAATTRPPCTRSADTRPSARSRLSISVEQFRLG